MRCAASALCLAAVLAGLPALAAPPHIAAGDRVAGDYAAFAAELTAFYGALKARLEQAAPELLKKIPPAPPRIMRPGYGMLPAIVENTEAPARPAGPYTVSSYSWPLTARWIERDRRQLSACAARLDNATRPRLQELLALYRQLDKNQKVMNGQIEYNRLWQGDIARRRAQYDATTRIYDDLVQGRIDAAQAAGRRLSELMAPPGPYLRLSQPAPRQYVIHAAIATDIDDDAFWASFRKAIGKYWHVAGKAHYEVALSIRKISSRQLYGKERPPSRGDRVDLGRHVPRFPAGSAVITTGAGCTHYAVAAGRCYLALGPGDITDTVLAHEFGHLLQLNDAYFRGYRDLGRDGFEVLEVVPDITDLMSAPGRGRVKPHHFAILVKALQARGPAGGR